MQTKCCGFLGSIFGHKMKPKFKEDIYPLGDDLASQLATAIQIEIMKETSSYLGEQCIRCGEFFPREEQQ